MDKRTLRREWTLLQKLLRDIRREAGLSQQKLAARLGVSQSFVSKYESGERRLDVLELRHICAAMQVSLPALLERFEQMLAKPS